MRRIEWGRRGEWKGERGAGKRSDRSIRRMWRRKRGRREEKGEGGESDGMRRGILTKTEMEIRKSSKKKQEKSKNAITRIKKKQRNIRGTQQKKTKATTKNKYKSSKQQRIIIKIIRP